MEHCYYFRALLQRSARVIPLILAVMVLATTQIYAQSGGRTISGTVADETGELLSSATVIAKTTAAGQPVQGTKTDAQGKFTLTLPPNTVSLEVRYTGFGSITVPLTQANTYNIILKSDSKILDEVTVVSTGMFSRNAQTFTGAVTSVTREMLLSRGNQNLLQSLSSIDPSLVLVSDLAVGSNPNSLPNINLRGQSALPDLKGEYQTNPNQPLFILDGFETELAKIIDLDINLVESITLLKDATAKAIYGSKAANGVVVIETRRPAGGQMRVSYTGTLNLEVPDLGSYDMTNAAEKLEVEKLGGLYSSPSAVTQISLTQKYNAALKEVLAGVSTDWLAQPTRMGVGQKHSIYLEGGDDAMLYGVDLSYNLISGAMKGSSRSTLSGGISLSYRVTNFIFRNKLSITSNNANESPWGSFREYTKMNPYLRLRDESGELIKDYARLDKDKLDKDKDKEDDMLVLQSNPIWNSTINTKYISAYTDITDNFHAEYTFRPNLKFIGRFGVTKQHLSSDNFKPGSHTDFVKYTEEQLYRKGSYFKSNGEALRLNGDIGANYSLTAGPHMLFMNGMLNITHNTYDNSWMEAEGFPNDYMDHISFATQYLKDGSPGGEESISRSVGGIASVNYSYDNRYLFDANYRLTGSSDYGANNRWGSFWSLGGGWNIHNEQFMSDAAWINTLKFRLSTGYTGSQGFSTFDALATLRYFTSTSYAGYIGSYLVALANPNLQWQKKYDNNIGLDFTLFDSALSGRFDYYISTTKGMLTDITMAPSAGFDTYRENLGEAENKGWEANVSYRVWSNPETRSRINIFASVAHNKNTLKQISNSLRQYNSEQDDILNGKDDPEKKALQTRPAVRFAEGQSLNAIWAVRSLGIDPENGKEIYLTKDGEVTYVYSAADQVVCGDNMPEYNGIFGVSAQLGNFNVNLAFNYQFGGQIYNQTLIDRVENADLKYNVDRRVLTDRWQKQGDMALYKAITDQSYTRPTSRFVQDYNVLSISSINVSYDFRDHRFVKNSFLGQLKMQVFLNNFATLSSVKIERGTDYPFSRNISFAIQATF